MATIKSVMFLPDQGVWILVEGFLQSVDIREENDDLSVFGESNRVRSMSSLLFDVQFRANQYWVVTEEWVRENFPEHTELPERKYLE